MADREKVIKGPECTRLNCPMQVGTVTENCGDNCPWRTTAKEGDLISRALALEVISAVKGITRSQSEKVLCGKMYSQIKDLPSAKATPVVYGQWLIREFGPDEIECTCSVCKYRDFVPRYDVLYWVNRKFCPNCGAKTDGKRGYVKKVLDTDPTPVL